jgi:phosphoenolpyruvate carboxylase
VVAEGLLEPEWQNFTSARATWRIKDALQRRESPPDTLSSEARRTMGVFQAIAHCRRKYGERSIGCYLVSRVTGPEDVLAVLLLARWGYLGPKGQDVPLDIAPLFETTEELENSAAIMARLMADERYRSHLRARGDRQIVMIGYAENNQDSSVATICWNMHRAIRALAETASEFGITLTLFHGRGGTVGRAGRRVNDAIVAAATSAGPSPLRMTETGERISVRYGLRGIAIRALEQTVGSLLEVAAQPPASDPRETGWGTLMQEIADASGQRYRELVESAGFMDYFRAATPVDVIERLNIAGSEAAEVSRPTTAGARRWEFAWVQNRCLMPAWFGFASGVLAAIERHGEADVREMFLAWPLARVLIADIELALAKADIGIASTYSELAGPLHEQFFPAIRHEYDQCVDCVLRLTGQKEILADSQTFSRTIRLRNPYVDPMSYLQVNLLRRWREAGRVDDDVLKALRASVNGIAHGMQNTG